MDGPTIGLFLPGSSIGYYEMVALDAELAGRETGLEVRPHFAENRAATQAKQIHDCIHGAPSTRPAAIIVMSIRDDSLNRLAREAAGRGIGWIFLNRRTDYLEELRREFPSVPISFVSPDQRQIGRIQGNQCRILAPGGGSVLYVEGNPDASSARERLAGMQEAIKGSGLEAQVINGNWTAEDTERTVSGWMRMVLPGKSKLEVIACQNDDMAIGALRARQSIASSLNRPEIALIPVTGCDGLVDVGQRLVNEGKLVATIILPSSGGPAVNLIARALKEGELPPPEVMLPNTSFPSEAVLATRRRTS